MVLTKLEQDIGLADVKGTITVGANIWAKKGQRISVEVVTTRRAFHNAMVADTRYSMEKTLKLMATGNKKEGLQALAYRAKYSDEHGLAIGEKNAVHLGVMKC